MGFRLYGEASPRNQVLCAVGLLCFAVVIFTVLVLFVQGSLPHPVGGAVVLLCFAAMFILTKILRKDVKKEQD